MAEVIAFLAEHGLKILVGAAILFGAAPVLILRLAVLFYPKGHPRRVELINELDEVPYKERLIWICAQVVGIAFDGLSERITRRIGRVRNTKKSKDESDDSDRQISAQVPDGSIGAAKALTEEPQWFRPDLEGGRDFREVIFTEQLDWDPVKHE